MSNSSSVGSPPNTDSSQDECPLVIYCDGAGSRPDGKGSGFAWIQPNTGKRHIEFVDGLTNNQAEYRALISALSAIPDGCIARIFTDSQLMWSQVIGNYRVHHPELSELLSQALRLIEEKNLRINLEWVPRQRNLAGKLL